VCTAEVEPCNQALTAVLVLHTVLYFVRARYQLCLLVWCRGGPLCGMQGWLWCWHLCSLALSGLNGSWLNCDTHLKVHLQQS